MEETEESNTNKTRMTEPHNYHHHHLLHNSNRINGFCYQNQYHTYPALLPLPPAIPLQLALAPPLPQYQNFRTKPHFQKHPISNPPLATSSEYQVPDFSIKPGNLYYKNPFSLISFSLYVILNL